MSTAVDPAMARPNGARGFLRTFALSLVAALSTVAVFNYLVDPYLVFHLPDDALPLSRPNKNRMSPLSKSLAIARFQPTVVYVGNSRTEVGLPAEDGALRAQRAFNAALTGASLGDAIAMARHAVAVSDVNLIVLGVDFWTFTAGQTNPHFDRALVGRSRFDYAWRGLALQLRHALSWDTTLANLSALRHAHAPDCPSFLSRAGQRDTECMAKIVRRMGGPRAAFEYWIRTVERSARHTPSSDRVRAIELLGEFIDDACRSRVTVRIYINPTHALMLDTLRLSGKWEEVEAWKRSLVEEVGRHPQCDPRLYDFSGYGSVASEPSPLVTGRDMQWFWEASHHRSRVGDLILARLLGVETTDAPASFGIELNRGGLERALSRERDEQRDYADRHAEEIAALRALLDDARSPSDAAPRSAPDTTATAE